MARVLSSRRVFLQQGSAALAAGVLGRTARGETPAARQAVACSRREAGEAARDVLLAGGNAIDAAAAALLVLCVIDPTKVGVGGYGGSLVVHRPKTGRVQAIDCTCRAARAFDASTFNVKSAFTGCLAVGVPGIVAGIDLALREFGTLPWKTVADRAATLAENGIAVTPTLAAQFTSLAKSIDPASRRAYFPEGVPAPGATWVQPDLGRLIRRLGDEGPSAFYRGDVAKKMVSQLRAGGSALTVEDFADFRAQVVEPLHINYRGVDLYTPPLPSGGLTSLSVLKTLEQFDVAELEPWGARYVELFAGASNLAWGERFEYFGDPEFVDVPAEELLSEKRAAARAARLREDAVPTVPVKPAPEPHTVNVVVIDKDQQMVSWTATHGGDFGAHVAIEGLGLMLGHGMSRFAFSRLDPNFPAGGKRPQHNMSPVVALRGGKPYAAWGLPGGRIIVSVTAQVGVNLIDFGAAAERAVNAPRIHTEGANPILVTSDMPKAVVEELRRSRREVELKPALGGPANAATIDAASGAVAAGTSGGSTGVLAF